MTQHDYKAALENFKGYAPYHDLYQTTEDAIIHALKVADKLMQEPSETMIDTIWYLTGETERTFIGVRDQILKEVEQDGQA